MDAYYWFFVWSLPALAAGLLTAPINLGYLPASPVWQWVVAAVAAILWFLAGRLGMQLLLRTRDLPRAWVTPTVVNVLMIPIWTLLADHRVFGLVASLLGLLSISLGMLIATLAHRNRGVSATT